MKSITVPSTSIEDYFSLADATLKAVQATVNDDPLVLNNLQCKVLVKMLQDARDAVIGRFPNMLTTTNSTISHPNGGLLVRKFYRIVKHVESLIVKSAEKPWLVAAIVIGDCKEEFCLRISEIARLIAIVEEKEDSDRRRWLRRIDDIVKSKECDWKERTSSAALTDEATFRVAMFSSSTQSSEFTKGSPEHLASRDLLQDDADRPKVGLVSIKEDKEKDEPGSWKDKLLCVSENDLKWPSLRELRNVMWMGKNFVQKTYDSDFLQPATIYSTFAHPNIVRFIGVVPSGSFLEERKALDLEDLLQGLHSENYISRSSGPPFDIFGALDIMLQVAEAMKYLHDRNLVHVRVRTRDVFLDVLSGPSIPFQERILLAKLAKSEISEIISGGEGTGMFQKEEDVDAYGKMCVEIFTGESFDYRSWSSIFVRHSCPPLCRNSCRVVWTQDGNMQALDPIEADEFAPVLRSERTEPDHQNQEDKTEASGHRCLLIILLILCMGLGLAAKKCWTLPIFSFLINVISVSIGLYLLDFHEPVIWKYRTWRFLQVVLGRKKTMEVANFLRESIPGLAPCNYVVDVGKYGTNVLAFMSRSLPVRVHQQKICPVPLHSGWRPLKREIVILPSVERFVKSKAVPLGSRWSSLSSSLRKPKLPSFPLHSGQHPLKRRSRSEIGSAKVSVDKESKLPISLHEPNIALGMLHSGQRPLKRTSRSEIGSVKVSHDEVPLDSGHLLLHVRFEIGSAKVSVVQLGFDNVHFTSTVGGRKMEDFVVAMDLERLGTILAILHRWELSPGIGVIENMIYRPGSIYCHCLGLQSIVEGVCESINQFSDFYLPISKTFYVGCIPKNQRGLYKNHAVLLLVGWIIPSVGSFFQLWRDYPIVAIVLTVVLLGFVLGANVLDVFGGLALPVLWYRLFYVLCCGGQRRSRFYLWLKKCGFSMAFCDDFKPVIHYARPGTIEMMTLPFCSLRDLSIPRGGPPLAWPPINVFLEPLGPRIQRIVLANNLEVECLRGEMREFKLKVGGRQVEAISNYVVGESGLLRTQLRLDARGMFRTYSWAEDSYFLFVYLMLKWSTMDYGVIKTVQRFFFKDSYHVFGTHELARHIANHKLFDYNIVTMRLDHTARVL